MPGRHLAIILVLVPFALPRGAGAHARLTGEFIMTGRVTAAHAVPDEHVGERVTRTWYFLAPCAKGQCRTERLTRARATGEDTLELHRRVGAFGRWTGKGSFLAPLECRSRFYPRGERVFFKITVRITGTALIGGVRVASRVRASYKSYRRTNRTRCVSGLGHDGAVYRGTLVIPPAPPVPTPPAPTPVLG